MALTKFVNVYKCRLCGEMFTSSGTNTPVMWTFKEDVNG